jgi:hypothetical protein
MQPKYKDQPHFLFVKSEAVLNLISILTPYFDVGIGIAGILLYTERGNSWWMYSNIANKYIVLESYR